MNEYIKILKEEVDNLLIEGVTDIVYHFTSVNGLTKILRDNEIKMSPTLGSQWDQKMNRGKFYMLSLTTSRSSDVGYAASKLKNNLIRLTLDGRKLNQNYKSISIDYWGKPKDPKDSLYVDGGERQTGRDFYKHVSRQDELEDRIVSDTEDGIRPANKYITIIEVLNVDDKYLGYLKNLADNLNIPFYVYDEQKYFDASLKSKAIDVTKKSADPEDGKTERGFDLYLAERFLSLVTYQNEEKRKEVLNNISKFGINSNEFNERLIKNQKEYKYSLSDFKIEDHSRTISSFIHNLRGSSVDKLQRYALKELIYDVKKSEANNIKDYVEEVFWRGLKNEKDIKKELYDNIIDVIRESLKSRLKIALQEEISYEIGDEEGENVFKNDLVINFIENVVEKLNKYYYNVIFNNPDFWNHPYEIKDWNVLEKIRLGEDETYGKLVDKFDFISNGHDNLLYFLKLILSSIPNDVTSYFDENWTEMQKQYYKQF